MHRRRIESAVSLLACSDDGRAGRRLRRRAYVRPRLRAPHGPATGTPPSSTTGRQCRRIRTASSTRSRSSARCSTRRSGISTRRGCSRRADNSRTRCASTAVRASSIRPTARSPARCSRWSGGFAIWPRRRARRPPFSSSSRPRGSHPSRCSTRHPANRSTSSSTTRACATSSIRWA